MALLGALASLACEPQAASPPPRAAQPVQARQPAPSDNFARAAESDSALRFPIVPIPRLTQGDTLEVTAADICVPGYSKKVRNVPAAVKRQVYESYGITRRKPGDYEVDHLISLELGGSNSVRNLWPESYRTHPWNARVKDALENELHRRVCAGTLDLGAAQRAIAQNWVIAYRIYVRPTPSDSRAAKRAPRARQSSPPPASRVP